MRKLSVVVVWVTLTFSGCGENMHPKLGLDEIKRVDPSFIQGKVYIGGRAYTLSGEACSKAIALLSTVSQAKSEIYHFDLGSTIDSDKDIAIRLINDENKERYLYFKYYQDINVFSMDSAPRKLDRNLVLTLEKYFDEIEKGVLK